MFAFSQVWLHCILGGRKGFHSFFFSYFPLSFFQWKWKSFRNKRVLLCRTKNNSFFSTTVCCTFSDCCFLIKNMFSHVAVVKFHLAEWAVQVELDGFGQQSHEGFLKVIIASMHYLNHTVSVPEGKGPVVGWHFQDKTGSHICSCK